MIIIKGVGKMKTVGAEENALAITLSSCPDAQSDSMQVKHSFS